MLALHEACRRFEACLHVCAQSGALTAGGIFGVSALTFGKWQLVASLGAVVFRTLGGPTIMSSILRTPGATPAHSMLLFMHAFASCAEQSA